MRRNTAPSLTRLIAGFAFPLGLGSLLAAMEPARAQTPGASAGSTSTASVAVAPQPTLVRDGGGGIEPRIERLALEDAAVRIEELRVGGQTRQILVSPKGGAPAYEVAPAGGTRVWNMLRF